MSQRQYKSDIYTALAKIFMIRCNNNTIKPVQQRNYDNFIERTNSLTIKRFRWQVFMMYLVNHDLQEMLASEMFDYHQTSKNINTFILRYWIHVDEKKFQSAQYAELIEAKVIEFFTDVVIKNKKFEYNNINELTIQLIDFLINKGYIKWQN